MTEAFHKYPHTPHLLWLGEGVPREDKIMSNTEAEEFLSVPVVVEEKIDGANLGFSVGLDGRIRAQNRGNFLIQGHCHAQWNPLWPWLAAREQALVALLGTKLMLFGEWCYAKHSVIYNNLPDWFLAFDIFDRTSTSYCSAAIRNALSGEIGLSTVPELFRGRLALSEVTSLIRESRFGASKMEGIYLRRESNDRLKTRAKVVNARFIQQINVHWTRRPLTQNRIDI